jgi:hypothetical protein
MTTNAPPRLEGLRHRTIITTRHYGSRGHQTATTRSATIPRPAGTGSVPPRLRFALHRAAAFALACVVAAVAATIVAITIAGPATPSTDRPQPSATAQAAPRPPTFG